MVQKLLIVGCGDIGRRVGKLATATGWQVSGLVRSDESARLAEQAGIDPLVVNLLDPDALAGLQSAGAMVLYAAPPPGGGVNDPKIRNFCQAIPAGAEPTKIIYLSTSGVYGDCHGDRVTEATPANPQTARARRRFDAETTVRQFGEQRNVPTIVLRVTGIYGPFRFALHRILEQHPLLNAAEAAFTNRIHADDLAQVCMAALDKGADDDIFNICDGQESTMTDYFNAVADAFDLPRPPQIGADEAAGVMNPLMLTYFQESRRMDNRKMLEKLGVTLRYPTLEQGLQASVEEMRRVDPEFFLQLKKTP